MFIAICDGTADSIYACAECEDDAKFLLWARVKAYLTAKKAPETQNYSYDRLEEYFGCVVLKVENNAGGFLR